MSFIHIILSFYFIILYIELLYYLKKEDSSRMKFSRSCPRRVSLENKNLVMSNNKKRENLKLRPTNQSRKRERESKNHMIINNNNISCRIELNWNKIKNNNFINIRCVCCCCCYCIKREIISTDRQSTRTNWNLFKYTYTLN